MRLHNDEPTLLDQLDRLDLVRRIGEDIATCAPPHVFGIHGDWGSGKTSFLHQLQAYLMGVCPQQPEDRLLEALDRNPAFKPRKNTDYVTVVWFEAWRYQNEQAPIVALLQERAVPVRTAPCHTGDRHEQEAKARFHPGSLSGGAAGGPPGAALRGT